MATHQDTSVIVVGVDGSEPSKDALRWAARQAELTGARLRAVAAWRQPLGYGIPVDYSDVDLEGNTRKGLEQTIEEVLGGPRTVEVITRVVQGHAHQVLVDEAKGAGLLVVGSHGHGTFTGMLLGSVSQFCVQHATCPVLVVRHRPE